MKTFITEILNKNVDEKINAADIAAFVGIREKELLNVRIHRKSLDVRFKNAPKEAVSYEIDVSDDVTVKKAALYSPPVDLLVNVERVSRPKKVVIAGAGPSGLFAARLLSEKGNEVIVLERGGDSSERKKAVGNYFGGGAFDAENNVQFGLGGAGAFSDGKLTTGISSPYLYTVFSEFVRCKAPEEIMYASLPHIGTDKLETVSRNLKSEIEKRGGKFSFHTRFCGIAAENGVLKGVYSEKNGIKVFSKCDALILAVGHSARDTFRELSNAVPMSFKPFAVGVRIEHPRRFIDEAQYGAVNAAKNFPSASYKLAENFSDGRRCYSFCMCPGGTVVAANSDKNSIVVNGMSDFARQADNSNSALVVNVNESDVAAYGNDALKGMRFQEELERKCFEETRKQKEYAAPCQNTADFMKDIVSKSFDIAPSYPLGVCSAEIKNVLPPFVTNVLKRALPLFGRKIKNFDRRGVLTAPESRTSSPVRILRDPVTSESCIKGVYPCGEGAGYSGGIVSSAVDGLKIALKINSD